jgi:hypothetical protein
LIQNSKLKDLAPVRGRRDIVSRKTYKFEFGDQDVNDIFKVTQHHTEYSIGATTLQGLPKFDDCEDYGLTADEQSSLVKKEIQKLLEVAADDRPYLFNSDGKLCRVDKAGFEEVSNLMDQIHCNFAIISHDNARIGLEHCPDRREESITDFKKSRKQLIGRFKVDQDRIKGILPKLLEPPKRNQELYHAMVDYLLGSIARLLVRSATGKLWLNYTFAILAQWAVKLKIVACDPARNAEISLSSGEDVIEQIAGSMNNKQTLLLKIKLGPEAKEEEVDTLDTETDISSLYYDENILFRIHMRQLVREAIFTMYDGTKLGKRDLTGAEYFETCNLVYHTGLDGVPTTINSDRYNNIGTSSKPIHINCIYGAGLLMLQNLEELQRILPTQSCTKRVDNRGGLVQWDWSEGTVEKKGNSLDLFCLDDVISVTVSQCLGTMYSADSLESLIYVASSVTSDEDPIRRFSPPHRSFAAMFTFQTEEFSIRKSRQRHDKHFDPEVRAVSESPLKSGVRGKLAIRLLYLATSMRGVDANRGF